MPVSLKKEPTRRDRRWLDLAEAIAGHGTGWPGRFVKLVEEAAEQGRVKTISLNHVQNVAAGHRSVTDDLERLIVVLAPEAAERMRMKAEILEDVAAGIDAELKEKQK